MQLILEGIFERIWLDEVFEVASEPKKRRLNSVDLADQKNLG